MMFANRAIKWLIGSDLLDFIKDEVEIVSTERIPGSEKRDRVFKKAKKFFSSSFSTFINMGIEIAVIMLENKMKNMGR